MKISLTMMALLLALGPSAAEAKSKRPRNEPYVVSDTRGFERGEDGKPPMYGRFVKVKNPTRQYLRVMVGCDGYPLLNTKFTIRPGHTVSFDLGTDDSVLVEGQCGLRGWTVWDGKTVVED